MIGKLVASIEWFLSFAERHNAITPNERKKLTREATTAILAAGAKQTYYLEATDPVDQFIAAIRQCIGSGLGHFRSMNAGIPKGATVLGWTQENSVSDMPTFKSRGPTLGWVSWQDDELYINITGGYDIIRKVAGPEISLTKQTMLKRLKDSGKVQRVDDARQRNTVRVTIEGHPRQVIALRLSEILETQEVPNDGE